MKSINKAEFDKLVYDTTTINENTKNLKFLGEKPVILDFYADWCQPCKMMVPTLEEIAKQYPNIDIYKINVDEQRELSQMFGIRSIPTLLLIPKNSTPQAINGAMGKTQLKKVIEDVLLENGIQDAEIIEES